MVSVCFGECFSGSEEVICGGGRGVTQRGKSWWGNMESVECEGNRTCRETLLYVPTKATGIIMAPSIADSCFEIGKWGWRLLMKSFNRGRSMAI